MAIKLEYKLVKGWHKRSIIINDSSLCKPRNQIHPRFHSWSTNKILTRIQILNIMIRFWPSKKIDKVCCVQGEVFLTAKPARCARPCQTDELFLMVPPRHFCYHHQHLHHFTDTHQPPQPDALSSGLGGFSGLEHDGAMEAQ